MYQREGACDMRLVSLEDHYGTAALLRELGSDYRWLPDSPVPGLLLGPDERVKAMDSGGISHEVLSLVAPGVQNLDAADSVKAAIVQNNLLHDTFVSAFPYHFSAFAALPLKDPIAAARELQRGVTELNFVGALINGGVDGKFLSNSFYDPIFEVAESLGKPLYIHPQYPHGDILTSYYRGDGINPEVSIALATTAYGWHYETSLQVTRMILAGTFTRYPKLKIIIGHLGEGLPFHLERMSDYLDNMDAGLSIPLIDYYRKHVWATTSGYPFSGPFELARQIFGDDRILFSVDSPFTDRSRMTEWITRQIADPELLAKISHVNAENLLGLD